MSWFISSLIFSIKVILDQHRWLFKLQAIEEDIITILTSLERLSWIQICAFLAHSVEIIACITELFPHLFEPLFGVFLKRICLFDHVEARFTLIRLVIEYILFTHVELFVHRLSCGTSGLRPSFCRLAFHNFSYSLVFFIIHEILRQFFIKLLLDLSHLSRLPLTLGVEVAEDVRADRVLYRTLGIHGFPSQVFLHLEINFFTILWLEFVRRR